MADQEHPPLTDAELDELEGLALAAQEGLVRRAVAEVRRLRDYKQMLEDNADELEKCNAELIADNARLRAALEKYGQHGYLCDHKTWILGPEGRASGSLAGCNCGLDAALANPT